jgi:hypothetical protein
VAARQGGRDGESAGALRGTDHEQAEGWHVLSKGCVEKSSPA